MNVTASKDTGGMEMNVKVIKTLFTITL